MARMAQALGMGGAMPPGMPKGVTPPGGMMNAMGGGGMDLNALKALGSGKLPGVPADLNSAPGQTGSGLPGLGGFPGVGRGLPNLPGLGRPGSGKK
jgi:signal recognition particle subunit SRP54